MHISPTKFSVVSHSRLFVSPGWNRTSLYQDISQGDPCLSRIKSQHSWGLVGKAKSWTPRETYGKLHSVAQWSWVPQALLQVIPIQIKAGGPLPHWLEEPFCSGCYQTLQPLLHLNPSWIWCSFLMELLLLQMPDFCTVLSLGLEYHACGFLFFFGKLMLFFQYPSQMLWEL